MFAVPGLRTPEPDQSLIKAPSGSEPADATESQKRTTALQMETTGRPAHSLGIGAFLSNCQIRCYCNVCQLFLDTFIFFFNCLFHMFITFAFCQYFIYIVLVALHDMAITKEITLGCLQVKQNQREM